MAPKAKTPKIQDQAILVQIKIKKFSNAITDKVLSSETATKYKSQDDLVRVRKTLLDSDIVKQLAKLAGHIRNNIVSHYTIPWSEDGMRLLPTELMDEFEDKLNESIEEWDTLVAKFGRHYKKAVQDAADKLGKAFDPNDYPDASEVSEKYQIIKQYQPLPSGGDLRVNLPAKKVDQLKKDIEKAVQEKVREANTHVHERVIETLDKLVGKLKSFGTDNKTGKAVGVFRDSTVTNLTDLIEVLPALNVTGDPKLTKAANNLLLKLRALDPQELRDDPKKRKQVAETAEQIQTNLAGLMD